MMLFARTLLLILAFPCAWVMNAQEISFIASVDRNTISVGERVKLTLTLSNSREQFTAPDLGGMIVVQGPFESSSVTNVNGRITATVSRTYLLTATQQGKYTIGPSRVRVGGGVIQSDPITIEVGPPTSRPTDPGVVQGQRSDPNLFITISLSKNRAYVGEQVVASYTLYSRYANIELTKYDLPTLNGFWSEDIDISNTGWEDQPEMINGLQYRVAILKKQVLFPQRAGKLRIDPAQITCTVNRSFFSRGSTINITSNAVEFTAQELPPNAPAGFTGSVGEIQMNVSVDRTNISADEAIELNIRLQGRTNLKLMDGPSLSFPGDFEVYDPKVIDRINITGNGMSGHREFQYLVIPRHEGIYELDPITFSYFDTRTGSYKTLRGDTITIEVAPGASGPSAGPMRQSSRDVTVLDRDIRYIRTGDLDLRPHDSYLFGSTLWTIGMATPALAFLLFLGWYRKREAALADQVGTRRRQADKLARRRLSEAGRALEKDRREEFYAALSKALNGYLADKFGLGIADVNTASMRQLLADHPDGEALGEKYAELMTACDMARFAPIEEKPRQQLFEQAVDLIGSIERHQRS